MYYYFPDGKEQIGAATALWSAEQMTRRIREALTLAENPADALRLLAPGIADAVEQSGFAARGPWMMLSAESAVRSAAYLYACIKEKLA